MFVVYGKTMNGNMRRGAKTYSHLLDKKVWVCFNTVITSTTDGNTH